MRPPALLCIIAFVISLSYDFVHAAESNNVAALAQASDMTPQKPSWHVEHCCGSQLASLHLESRTHQVQQILLVSYKTEVACLSQHESCMQQNMTEGTVDPGTEPFSLVVLSIVKDNNSWGKGREFQDYLSLLMNITQETSNLQLALGLSIADEHTFSGIGCSLALYTGNTKLKTLCSTHNHKAAKTASHNLRKLNLRRVSLIHAAEDAHLASLTEKTKRNPQGQMLRRRGLAQVRNQLLFRALKHEDAVLWIDSDIVAAPADMIPAMIASNRDIITPLCYFPKRTFWREELTYFDYNVFQGTPDSPDGNEVLQVADGSLYPQRDRKTRYGNITYLDELAQQNPNEDFVQLSSVGGTMVWIKAAVHRDGIVFPIANVVGSEWQRQGWIGLETEGICWTAQFLGYKCWGMPHMAIQHSDL